jgi:hypothetical protein
MDTEGRATSDFSCGIGFRSAGGVHTGGATGSIRRHYSTPMHQKPATVILDREVCIFDRQLISRFEWLRHGKLPDVATPPIFMVFDCLHAAGHDLR